MTLPDTTDFTPPEMTPVTITVGTHEPELLGYCWPDDDPERIMHTVQTAIKHLETSLATDDPSLWVDYDK